MAADISHTSRPTKYAGAYHPLRQHREEEMGYQLCVHGVVRLRRRALLLGGVGLPNVIRQTIPTIPRPPQLRVGGEFPASTSLPRPLTERNNGLFPVRVRRPNVDSDSRCIVGEDELLRMGVVRAAMGYDVVYCLRL